MANSLPWSVKGVDPRTRDAAKAAARRAGMTLGEWLDRKILDESGQEVVETPPEQLDIAALSERLARLSTGQMDTAPRASAGPAPRASRPEPSRGEIETLLGKAEAFEKLTRESDARTAGALDSIARWIEKTETRISAGERNAAERQERATNVIAEAIKTMGERIADIERRSAEAPRAQQAPRLAFNRDALAAAVTDIKTRQRLLDQDGAAAPLHEPTQPESRLSAIRNDLRELSARLAPAAPPPARPAPARPAAPVRDPQLDALTGMIADLGARLDGLDRRERLEPILKPLARIESEVGRLAQEQHGEGYRGIEREIAHLAAKVDTLAARGSDGAALEPVLRDIADLREMLATDPGGGKLEELAQQVSTLAFEIGRLRDAQPDGRELRNLSMALDDVRGAVMSDRAERAREHPAAAASLAALSRQIEQLAGRLDEVAAQRPTDQIEDRIDALQQRIETLLEHGPAAVTRQIEALAGRIESLAASSNLAQIVNEGKSVKVAQVDLRPVEDMLRSLAAKIDEAGRPGADAAAFDSLEQQIAGLADRLDAAAATRSAETGLERTLEDLVVHLRSLHEDSAADRAAIADIAARTAPPSGIAELSSLVSGLRDSHATAGRQTQDAIGAVHQTLETIISRLSSLETELASERDGQGERAARPKAPSLPHASTPAPAAKAAAFGAALADRLRPQPTPPRIEPALQDGPAPSPAPGIDTPLDTPLDLPLEPGSGRPRPDSALAGGSDPQSIRQSLIAAARRSAKAASEAAAAAPTPAPEPAKSKGRLRDMMSKRKKPLLLGLAAIVLALGTAHVVTGALKGGKPASNENETAKSLIAPPARQEAAAQPAPEAAARSETAALAPAQPAAPAPETAGPAAPPPAAEITGSTIQPDPTAQAVQPVTGIGELPATLGTPGMRKAAMEGDARAVYELASRAVDGPAGGRDLKLALRLFERAAVAGLAPAQFRLGNMFEKGTGTPRDIALARTWYQRAADRGNAKAMHNLAVLHAEGVTGKPDYATATEWFRKAADLGVRDSQYNLAVLLGRGLGAATDLGQSYVWFSVAATQGDEDAGKKRDEVAQRLEPAELAAARALASQWKPKPLDPAANEVTPPARGWDASPSASATKPPKQAKL
ncbi:MAG: hypothetical protein DI527_03145 [Chelatococcus sp.]|nr:MAG: hypothetical protein DI527_03145 [Chelatococcus sp.]